MALGSGGLQDSSRWRAPSAKGRKNAYLVAAQPDVVVEGAGPECALLRIILSDYGSKTCDRRPGVLPLVMLEL